MGGGRGMRSDSRDQCASADVEYRVDSTVCDCIPEGTALRDEQSVEKSPVWGDVGLAARTFRDARLLRTPSHQPSMRS